MALYESGEAFAELMGNRQGRFGMHTSDYVTAGWNGIYVGDREFDPTRHQPSDINHFSIMAAATGEPYVRNVLPAIPRDITIITEHDGRRDTPEVNAAKYALGQQLRGELKTALPRIGDSVYQYHIGPTTDSVDLRHVELLDRPEDPLETVDMIANLCRGGLSFVIGNFSPKNIPLRKADVSFTDTIGIRVMHPEELAVSESEKRRLNKGNEIVSATDARTFNRAQARYNQAVERDMQDVGIKVARVVLKNTAHNHLLFDEAAVDTAISEAICSLDYKA